MPNRVFGDPQVDIIRAQLQLKGAGGGGGGPSARVALGPVRFIDPSNSTGLANDNNSGASLVDPILTTGHLNSLLFQRFLTGLTTITYMSDDPGSVGLEYGTMDLGSFNLKFQGAPQTLHTGGTLNGGTVTYNPAAPGGGQRQTLHATDILTWAPFIFTGLGGAATFPTYLFDTTAPRNGNFCWIVSAIGATASANIVLDSVFGLSTVAPGDGYVVRRGSRLNRASSNIPVSSGGVVTFQDFAFDIEDLGNQGGFTPGGSITAYLRCSCNSNSVTPGEYSGCYAGAGIVQTGSAGEIDLSSCVLVTTQVDQSISPLVLSNDTYVTGFGLVGASNAYAAITIIASAGAGVQIQDTTGPAGLLVANSIALVSTTGVNILLWGNGNAGVGVAIEPGASLVVPDEPTTTPTVTGTVGDFGFIGLTGATVTVGRAWNEAVGAYTEAGGPPTRTTTWARFAAAIGAGGFGFAAHDVTTGATIVGL